MKLTLQKEVFQSHNANDSANRIVISKPFFYEEVPLSRKTIIAN